MNIQATHVHMEQNGQDECMETAEVTERIRELSLLDIEEIIAQTQAREAQMQESIAKLEEAVAKADYALASELKANVTKTEEELRDLKAAQELAVRKKKKRAREEAFAEAREACDSDALLPTAAEVAATSDGVWEKRIDEILAPLKPAQETVLLLLRHSLKLAAQHGCFEVKILPRLDATNGLCTDESSYADICRHLQQEHLKPDSIHMPPKYNICDTRWTYIPQTTGKAFPCQRLVYQSGTVIETCRSSGRETRRRIVGHITCTPDNIDYLCDFWVCMGRPSEGSLCEELWRAWSRISYFVDLGCMVITVAAQLTEEDVSMIYEHFPKFQLWYSRHVVLSASRPDIQNADVIAQMFDGEAICEDFHSIMCNSTVGRLNTLWLLREAGYQATWKEKDGLIVSYRSFMHHPPVPKHTFLKFVQSSLGGDISSIMPK
jgi:hypothetical protein